jgi:prepilin-type N-terminal cleavage/methylation domain-containing protein
MRVALSTLESRTPCRPAGFTLIEVMTAVAIILILMAMLFPVVKVVRDIARKQKAQTEVASLYHAFKQYYNDYSRWPTNLMGSDTGLNIEDNMPGIAVGTNLIQVFAGVDVNGQNPRQVVYWEAPPGSVSSNGFFIDPWREPYKYMCDFNYDGTLHMELVGGSVRTNLDSVGVGVWSKGPNMNDDNAGTCADDLTTWN